MNEEQKNSIIKQNKIINSLQEYNLAINEEGMLIKMIQKNKTYQQFESEYPKIIKLISKFIKTQLILKYNMSKYPILIPNKDIIYCSHNLVIPNLIKKTKILIILTDPNNPLGVMSKSHLIFNNIIAGSVFPFIDVAINKNYDVVMPVIYKKTQTDNIDSILDNVWKAFIQIRYKYITDIVIISHKTATINLIKLMNKYPSNFIDKTRKIMLINSKHFDMYNILNSDIKEFFRQKATNYILSNAPISTLIFPSSTSLE